MVADSQGYTETSTYDAAHQLTRRQTSAYDWVDFQYDKNGREIAQTRHHSTSGPPSASSAPKIIGVVVNGGPVSGTDANNKTPYLFGQNSIVVQLLVTFDQSVTGQAVTTYTYDSAGAGNRTAASTTGTNNTAGAGWDALDPVSKTYTTGTDNKYTGDGEWNYSYDASGNLTGKVNVSSTDQNGVQWVYYYDNLNRLTKAERDRDGDGIGAGDASTQIDLRVVYKYDANGNRVSKSVDTDGDGYIWNAAGQYASTVDSYSSQNATNTATKATGATNSDYWTPSSLNSANEWIILNFATVAKADGIVIKEAAGTAGNGFITRIDLIESGGTAHTVFSGTDPVKLDGYLRITFPLTSYNVAKVKIFVNGQIHSTVLPAIDSVELRRHSVSTTVNGSAVETKYTLDGWNPAKGYAIGLENVDVWTENIVGTSTKTHYTRGDRVDQLLGRVDANGTFWMLTDKLGSVRGVVDNGGILAAQVDYDAFGNIIGSFQNPNITTAGLGRYGWTGREIETELGLQYNRARYYDPAMGRWISKDPMGFAAGDSNLYRYVKNSPTYAVDPSGLDNPDIFDRVGQRKRDERLFIEMQGIGTWNAYQFFDFGLKLPRSRIIGWDYAPTYGFIPYWTPREVGTSAWTAYNYGCIGLAQMRTGSFADGPGRPQKIPYLLPNVKGFARLDDAMKYQKTVKERTILFAVLVNRAAEKEVKIYGSPIGEQIDPETLNLSLAEPYDFNTAFQKKDCTVLFWVHASSGLRPNSEVYHSKDLEKEGNRVPYFFIVSYPPGKEPRLAPPIAP